MRFLFLIAVFATVLTACSSDDKSEQSSDSMKACPPKPVNPNGDSELAILMREMANWTDSCKSALTADRTSPAKPFGIVQLYSAKRTDETIDESVFRSMATAYESSVHAFETSTPENKVEMFNAMVNACAGCHENFCQGPLVRINKMRIGE